MPVLNKNAKKTGLKWLIEGGHFSGVCEKGLISGALKNDLDETFDSFR